MQPWFLPAKWTTVLLLLGSLPLIAGNDVYYGRPERQQILSFHEIDKAASDIIQKLKSLYPHSRDTIAVLGGAAVAKYLPNQRWTWVGS